MKTRFIKESWRGAPMIEFKYKRGKNDKNILVSYCDAPTSNCQIMSIGNIENILLDNYTVDEIYYMFRQMKRLSYDKRLMLLDVHQEKFNRFNFENYGEIIVKSNYTSTNKSKMTLILFKLDSNFTDKPREQVEINRYKRHKKTIEK